MTCGEQERILLYVMNPVRQAFNTWKKRNPTRTMRQFATELGYSDPDPIYRQMRGEYVPPYAKAAKYAEILGNGWTPGRVIDGCAGGER